MKKKFLPLALILALVLPTHASAQIAAGGPRGTYADRTVRGAYVLTAVNQAVTGVESLFNLEAEANRGFRITKLCIDPGSATAATWTLWQLIRTTAVASSGGTVIASEATASTNSITKMFSGDASWAGLARVAGTEGTSGAILDQGTIFVNATATPPTMQPSTCFSYCDNSGICPTVDPGILNGVKLMLTGTAGGVAASAKLYFISE